jgi:hypothetical protein
MGGQYAGNDLPAERETQARTGIQAKVNKQLCYNFDEENSINPVKGRANNGMAFTITQHVSLGGWCGASVGGAKMS